MTNLRAGISALAVTAAVTAGGIGAATAATHPAHPGHAGHAGHSSAPCAQEQRHVDKAQAKLDALTARFAAARTTVHQDKREVAATHGSERARAKKVLALAKVRKHEVARAKKAQVQRLAHATARLQKCQAGTATTTPTDTPTVVPTATVSPTGA